MTQNVNVTISCGPVGWSTYHIKGFMLSDCPKTSTRWLFIAHEHIFMLQISEDDQFIFCGTTSGDIMKINMKTGLLSDCGPIKKKYCLVSHCEIIHYVPNMALCTFYYL